MESDPHSTGLPGLAPAMSLTHLPLPALLACLMFLVACAQTPRQDPASIPLPLPQSKAEIEVHQQRAAHLRDQAEGLREKAEAVYKREDADCFPKILVNACRDKARASYIKQLQQARTLEIEASQLDRAARQRLLELNPARELPDTPRPSSQPASPANPAPVVNAVPARPLPKAAEPPTAASPAAEARALQERERRAAAAEQRRQREAAAAAERARKAREDAERYAERAARKAAEKPEAKASAPR